MQEAHTASHVTRFSYARIVRVEPYVYPAMMDLPNTIYVGSTDYMYYRVHVDKAKNYLQIVVPRRIAEGLEAPMGVTGPTYVAREKKR